GDVDRKGQGRCCWMLGEKPDMIACESVALPNAGKHIKLLCCPQSKHAWGCPGLLPMLALPFVARKRQEPHDPPSYRPQPDGRSTLDRLERGAGCTIGPGRNPGRLAGDRSERHAPVRAGVRGPDRPAPAGRA